MRSNLDQHTAKLTQQLTGTVTRTQRYRCFFDTLSAKRVKTCRICRVPAYCCCPKYSGCGWCHWPGLELQGPAGAAWVQLQSLDASNLLCCGAELLHTGGGYRSCSPVMTRCSWFRSTPMRVIKSHKHKHVVQKHAVLHACAFHSNVTSDLR